jgi:hypothetical protein
LTDVVQSQSLLSVASGEATTSFASREIQVDQEQRQLEVGLSQVASSSKKNPVLSPRAAVANTYFGQIISSKVDMRKEGGDKGRRNPPFFKGNNTSLATYGRNAEDVGDELKDRNLLCVLCKGIHHLERCHKFRAQNLEERFNKV